MTQRVSIADLMALSGIAFGTSGARGGFLQHLEDIGQFAPRSDLAAFFWARL